MQIPLEARQKLQALRAKVFNGANAEPQVTHALQVLQPLLNSYNISKEATPDRYSRFVGALHDSMMGYQQGEAKPIKSDDEIKKLGSLLLRSKPTGTHFWNSDTTEFESPGDSKMQSMMKEGLRRAYGREPTDEEVGNALLRNRFELLGSGSGAKKPAGGQ
jgi:hypothetical protein